MTDSKVSSLGSQLWEKWANCEYVEFLRSQCPYSIAGTVGLAIILPVVLSILWVGKRKVKQRGVAGEVGGERGLAVRNGKFKKLVEVPWEGATTVAALFEQACKKHEHHRFLGTRKMCLQQLQYRIDISYDSSNPEHQDALQALWKTAFPGEELHDLIVGAGVLHS